MWIQPREGVIERFALSDDRLGDQRAEGKFEVERKGTEGFRFLSKKDARPFAEESERKEVRGYRSGCTSV